jgi:Raf kinase inhibitor-like YbhB/YbcL family protein
MKLNCTEFQDGESIPQRHTGDGEDVSPALTWSDPPAATKSFALICDDPDAPRGTWVHWVLFNLPGELRELGEGKVPKGAAQGVNDFGNQDYGGPAPPRGKPHRYFFKLYALDRLLDLPEGATKEQVLAAAKPHILAEAQVMGKYQRV